MNINELEAAGLSLQRDEDGLVLTGDGQQLRADFAHLLPRLKYHNLQGELLVKAAKIRTEKTKLTAIDATAGFGEDSFLLAAAGYSVQMYEYDPVIAALLKDALLRAEQNPELKPVAARMTLTEGDSITALHGLLEPPAVILLDPMFPERQKSALVKKKFQLLHRLERPCEDEQILLQAALDAHPQKIVIKRPLKGPYLAGIRPDYSLTGKAIRYDCIICR